MELSICENLHQCVLAFLGRMLLKPLPGSYCWIISTDGKLPMSSIVILHFRVFCQFLLCMAQVIYSVILVTKCRAKNDQASGTTRNRPPELRRKWVPANRIHTILLRPININRWSAPTKVRCDQPACLQRDWTSRRRSLRMMDWAKAQMLIRIPIEQCSVAAPGQQNQ